MVGGKEAALPFVATVTPAATEEGVCQRPCALTGPRQSGPLQCVRHPETWGAQRESSRKIRGGRNQFILFFFFAQVFIEHLLRFRCRKENV